MIEALFFYLFAAVMLGAGLMVVVGMTTVLFLGGWLPPLDIWPLNLVPGPLWFIPVSYTHLRAHET